MPTLKIEFDNQDTLEYFKNWLAGSGEQDYWDWMSYRDAAYEEDITVVVFHYNTKQPDGTWKDTGNTIKAVSGRLENEEEG
jgi:hypothetical protein